MKESQGSLANDLVFMRPGHCAGDLVQASQWKLLHESVGKVEVDAHIPAHLLNPRQQLFGGFTGTYVDMISIYTARTLYPDQADFWVSTVNMRIDYLEPVWGPRVRLRGELIKQGKSTVLVATHFLDRDGNILVYAIATLRMLAKQE
ncbi:MAG: PaaI family thioesterase [Pseudomonadales bacterium]|nr:PaaI family thioesterase [Pseudomonadales bacterium]